MKPFLQTLAENLFAKYGPAISEHCIVFPNRRAGLFFRRFLSQLSDKPLWSPKILGIEEFVCEISPLTKVDKLTLTFELHSIYQKHYRQKEDFEQFYFWGEMLLKDFDEIDKSMVDAQYLFQNMLLQKELDLRFEDFLTTEQIEVLKSFWANFDNEKTSKQQLDFLKIWEALPKIYQDFREYLEKSGKGYEGLIFRDAAERLQAGHATLPFPKVIFAGFNALTACEEAIMKSLLRQGKAEIYWDTDKLYMDNPLHEAGYFLRKYRKDKVLGSTFAQNLPDQFADKTSKHIETVAVSLESGQAKVVGDLLRNFSKPDDLLKTIVLLPNQHMLFPVLHSLPQAIETVNVTMGYPLRNTPLYSLVVHLIEMQLTAKASTRTGDALFHHRCVLAILRHPYILYHNSDTVIDNIRDIEQTNKVYLGLHHLKNADPLFDMIFTKITEVNGIFDYLLDLLLFIHKYIKAEQYEKQTFEEEYIYQVYTHLKRLQEIVKHNKVELDVEGFWKLFRQMLESINLPFTGEPLRGLQIMGMLESRNLDFENVLVLSMNEGEMPPAQSSGSFIPYNLRKAFGLQTREEHDAMYAYYFYRLLQQAKNVYLLHNTETSGGLSGEMSRFVYQLQYESGFRIHAKTLSHPVKPMAPLPLTIQKTPYVLQTLSVYLADQTENPKRLTPSAINTYIDCPLKFYMQYIAGLKEVDAVTEEIDRPTFGNLLHGTMEELYKGLRSKKKNGHVTKEDFGWLKEVLDDKIDTAYEKLFFTEGNSPDWEGRNIIVKAIIKKYASRILTLDEDYAPFEILSLESGKGYNMDFEISVNHQSHKVALKGIIDRIDLKDNIIRVLDYKTGSDKKQFNNIESLFDPAESDRKKGVMQVLYYGMLFNETHRGEQSVSSGLLNTKELFADDFKYTEGYKVKMGRGRNPDVIHQIDHVLDAYKEGLRTTLEEIFSDEKPFFQTIDTDKCLYCNYKIICHRD